MNSWCGIGRLSRDTQTRFEPSGSQVTTFTLCIAEPGRNGETFMLYVGIECYGKVGEQASTLNGQDLLSVQGKLKWKSYTDKKGEKRSTLCVLAQSLQVLQPAPASVEAANN